VKGKYTIERTHSRWYCVIAPGGKRIAWDCTWRTARKIADALNGIQFQQLLLARLETELKLYEARALNAQQVKP
jgi:hypothetical protein